MLVLTCPILYADAYSRGGGRGAWGRLVAQIHNPMPLTWDIWIRLLKPGQVLDWAIVESEHKIISPGATLTLDWGLTILKDEIFRIEVDGWPYPADYSVAPQYIGAVDIAHLTYYPLIGYDENGDPIYG